MVEQMLMLAASLSRQSVLDGSATLRRRAVSTAYYAVFHALASMCARELLDDGDATTKSSEYERVYRALDHGSLKNAFKSAPLKDSEQLSLIGERVVELQRERIRSNYLPSAPLYTRAACTRLVNSAKTSVVMIDGLSTSDRRTLAVYLIFKNR